MERLRMFAGPNGSGKTTLINEVRKRYSLGYFINADEIEAALRKSGFIDCNNFVPAVLSQDDWTIFKKAMSDKDSRFSIEELSSIEIHDNILTINRELINSYLAAIIADFFRNTLLHCKTSFSFETVMSHPSKIDFLKEAKDNGFRTYLYFISTRDPSINENRVTIRVQKGGHNVSVEKIQQRYYKSMALLTDAFLSADRAFVLDNSGDEKLGVLVEKDNDTVHIHANKVPEWVQIYLLENLLK